MARNSDLDSITNLLKAHDVPLSAVKANKRMLEIGLMAEKERESSTRPGVMKKYKVLVDAGLAYGINQENPQSPDQTSPYYYRESFPDLLKLLIDVTE